MQEAPPPLGSLAARATVTYAAAPAVPAALAGDTSRRAPPVSAAGTRAVPGRNKVILEKGHSQVDWMRLTKTHPDLAGAPCASLRLRAPADRPRRPGWLCAAHVHAGRGCAAPRGG